MERLFFFSFVVSVLIVEIFAWNEKPVFWRKGEHVVRFSCRPSFQHFGHVRHFSSISDKAKIPSLCAWEARVGSAPWAARAPQRLRHGSAPGNPGADGNVPNWSEKGGVRRALGLWPPLQEFWWRRLKRIRGLVRISDQDRRCWEGRCPQVGLLLRFWEEQPCRTALSSSRSALLMLSPPAQCCSPSPAALGSCPPLPPAQEKQDSPVRSSVPFRCHPLEAEICRPGAALPMDSVKTRS